MVLKEIFYATYVHGATKMVLKVGAQCEQCKFWKGTFLICDYWQGSMSAFEVLEIRVFLCWPLEIHWSQVANEWVVSEIHDFWGKEMLEIHTFCGFLDEFSAWSHELQWRCRILFPSVTGKVWNSWRIYMTFCKVGQFCGASQTHQRSKLVHCNGRSEDALAVF